MNVAWLKKWTYTHQAWQEMWSSWNYIPQGSNPETIKYIMWTRGIWILPKLNVYWWPVEEVMSGIWKIREAVMLWYFPLKIHHVLAWIWDSDDLKEIMAHPQALMQCSEWLTKLWTNPEKLFREAYKTPKIYETQEFILELDKKLWSLSVALEVFRRNNINIEYLHSTPYGKNKYRFYLLVNEKYFDTIKSEAFLSEIGEIWWNLTQDNQKKEVGDWKIQLIWTKTNVDWIPLAQKDKTIWVICSKESAEKNRLSILENPFCPADNETHFSIISTLPWVETEQFKWIITDKVIALLSLSDKVWALAEALKIIRDAWLSLSFIMSLANNIWWYDFPLVMDKTHEIFSAQKEILKIWWNLRVL